MHTAHDNPSESLLYEIWKENNFALPLVANDGSKIQIIYPGDENLDYAGPDFKNARIKIDNLTYVGDVEIDNEVSLWKKHGHNIDKHYSKVVLHIAYKNNSNTHYVFNREGRKIPTLTLSEYVTSSKLSALKIQQPQKRNLSQIKCEHKNSIFSIADKVRILNDLGIRRFKNKSERIHQRLKELSYLKENNIHEPVIRYDLSDNFYNKIFTRNDFNSTLIWNQVFYEMLFEALGYSKNKDQMRCLAQYANIEVIKSFKNNPDLLSIEAVLFKISGLLPYKSIQNDNIPEYIELLNNIWEIHYKSYDGDKLESTDWHFFKLRPANFPTIRIAGGAVLLHRIINANLVQEIINLIKYSSDISQIIKQLKSIFITTGAGYWKNHFMFNKKSAYETKYFIGISRTDEIIVNVVLPFFYLYGIIFELKDLENKCLQIFSKYIQKSDNAIVNTINSSFELENEWKQSVISQGMLELFRNYCSKNKCLECEIGKVVFE